jgi:hypothetical protein
VADADFKKNRVQTFKYLETLYSKVNMHIRNSSPLVKYYTDDNKNVVTSFNGLKDDN